MSARALWVVLLVTLGCSTSPGGRPELTGHAEDLWGNPVDLDDFADGTTLLLPFSPANCGYCLFDGEFVGQNYARLNGENGGANLHMCLFNPQLDVLTYAKHFRFESMILTFPPALHRLHQNGFPWITVFEDGRSSYRGPAAPYGPVWSELKSKHWPDASLALTSPLHMAMRFIFENQLGEAIHVVADGDGARLDSLRSSYRNWRTPPDVRFESELSPRDIQKNLYFCGPTRAFSLDALKDQATPIQIDSTQVSIGAYRLPVGAVSVVACFPNPHHRQRYVVLKLSGDQAAAPITHNWVDFTIYGGESSEPILEGFFTKRDGAPWEFDPGSAVIGAGLARYCSGGRCPAPVTMPQDGDARPAEREAARGAGRQPADPSRAASGHFTLGAPPARFPRLAVDDGGRAWVVWDQQGDVMLAAVEETGAGEHIAIETDASDSFHPVVVFDGSTPWVFYVNDADGFYRIYGCHLDGDRRSAPLLMSERGLSDAVTPAAASDGANNIVLAWSDWRANHRLLRHRWIRNGVLGDHRDATIRLPADGYENAWWPSLALAPSGEVTAAWNQHYPALLGVCAGDLAAPAQSVTRLADRESDVAAHQNGGYPSVAVGRDGQAWVAWESFGWDVLSGKAQQILTSRYDRDAERWRLPTNLSDAETTFFNQTPRLAAATDGTVYAVWSGRDREGAQPWAIYLAHHDGRRWSRPVRVSDTGANARAPDVATGSGGQVWIAWHQGRGDTMRVEVRLLEAAATARTHSS